MADSCGVITRYQRLMLLPSFLILSTNIAILVSTRWLPDDPMHLVTHLSVYSTLACILSVLGVVGVFRRNITLLSIFSNYLFIDAAICAVPRILLFLIFPEIRSSICSLDSIQIWLQSQVKSYDNMTDNERAVVMANLQSQCRNVVGVSQAVISLLAAGATVMQIFMAIKVRRFAFMLQRADIYGEDGIGTGMNEEDGMTMTRYTDDEARHSRRGQEMRMI